MSDVDTAVESTPRSVAILGADALLVALPSTPTQLANACFAGGSAEVFPATWGDELIAAGCLEQLESRTGPAIFCACPLVAEQLRGAAELRRFIIPLISPPVAVARYLRMLFPDDALRITYVGDCPGADDESIDVRLSPHELLSTLAKRGILPATQRPDLGAHVAHDRRRFYSIPGGVPSPQWLGAQWPKRTLVDVHASDALASLANQTLSRGNNLIDFAPHLGCACSGAVGGTSTQDARKSVVALEPPRAQSEIVNAAVRVEVSLAPAGEQPTAEVTWGDFLAALPAALAMHPENSTGSVSVTTSRTAPRRALQKKAALPRAYMAARAGARRERVTSPRVGTTQPIEAMHHSLRAIAASETGNEVSARNSSAGTDVQRRDEITGMRPNPWVARRASQEGMTGPRGAPVARSGLANADRWLLAGLMLTSSLLVAVLTSALTVRGMQSSGAPTIAARPETVVTVAAAPIPSAHDSAIAARVRHRTDSILVASTNTVLDSAGNRAEAGGSVAPPPALSPRLSPMPAQSPRATKPEPKREPKPEPKREPTRAERRPVSVAEHVRATVPQPQPSPRQQSAAPPPAIAPPSLSAQNVSPATAAASSSSPTASAASTSATSSPPSSPPAAAAAPVNNAAFLEELRAIHAEINARKKHMDSLTASLDSLKHIKP
jgi:outer membrane biosynthesis protein TonB